MKKLFLLFLFFLVYSCSTLKFGKSHEGIIVAAIDLVNIQDDKIEVSIDPGRFSSMPVTFSLPKTVPGTYSEDNFGRMIENLRALNYTGEELPVIKDGLNTWIIPEGKELDKITYQVNDTYDSEGEDGVFSPAGTNIEENENFMLNLHGFVGYIHGMEDSAYRLEVKRPSNVIAGSALKVTTTVEETGGFKKDLFDVKRYFEVTDNPIMYSLPDTTNFTVEGMEVLISVYSPNKVHSAQAIRPAIERMIKNQKKFLGEIDNTSKYAILIYLSDSDRDDARGFGALEHHTSTVVVFPESMSMDQLEQGMTDVVSHEFFHILTPLNLHSKEIHHFDYNNPLMSQHLWMYEGVTEYFAHLFQVKQEIINNVEFYGRLAEKIRVSKDYDDTVPFTIMSENILQENYNDNFYNVYQKGALIGMALDIRLRELSAGKKGLLHVMKDLSIKYGKDNPFEDDQLFQEIVDLTYPEIETFFSAYVRGHETIPYDRFFDKVGLELHIQQVPTGYLVRGNEPYVDLNGETGQLYFRRHIAFNSFLEDLGIQPGDIVRSINGKPITVENVGEQIRESLSWEEGKEIKMIVERDGRIISLETVTNFPTVNSWRIVERDLEQDHPAKRLREFWLKG